MAIIKYDNRVAVPIDEEMSGQLVTIDGKTYKLVDQGSAKNSEINSQWMTMIRYGAIGLACIVGIKLMAGVFTPVQPAPTVIYPPTNSEPDKTCVFSVGC